MTMPDTPDQVALAVRQAIRAHTMGSTRSQQSAQKLIGISEIGGCRAYLARMILQLPFDEMDDIKWAAFCGTALGERLEMAVRETVPGVFTQVPLTATLPSGLKISGSADIVKAGQGIWDFKGLALDTPIPTPSGWTTMERVEVGDQVIDMHGQSVPVVAKSQVKKIECYRVWLDRSSFSITCDAEHVWWVLDPHHRLREMNVRDMQGGKGYRLPVAQPIDLPAAALPVDPWFLGYWLGDGNRTGLALSSHHDDVDEVAAAVRSAGYVASVTHNRSGLGSTVNVSNGRARDGATGRIIVGALRKAMADLGVTGNKHVPEIYLRGSIPQRLALLRGLMDSDGGWNKPRQRAQFVNTNRNLRDAVVELARSLGQKVSTGEHVATGYGRSVKAYTCQFTPTINPFSLSRKVALADAMPKRAKERTGGFSISLVEQVESVPTQCIAVDSPTRSFLAGERMVPTHNTVNGLEMIRRNGPSFQQQAQANTYLLAAIQAGLVPEDGCWYLVYVDRSGADDMPHVVAHTYDPDVTAIVSQRLEDVMYAVLRDLDSAQRDMPHDWCMKVCPFYSNCRGRDEHQVQGLIEAEEHRQAVKDYQEGKRLEKAGKALADEAKEMLLGVSGSTGETEVSWTVVPETTIPTYERSAYTRMTLRKVTKPTRPDC